MKTQNTPKKSTTSIKKHTKTKNTIKQNNKNHNEIQNINH